MLVLQRREWMGKNLQVWTLTHKNRYIKFLLFELLQTSKLAIPFLETIHDDVDISSCLLLSTHQTINKQYQIIIQEKYITCCWLSSSFVFYSLQESPLIYVDLVIKHTALKTWTTCP